MDGVWWGPVALKAQCSPTNKPIYYKKKAALKILKTWCKYDALWEEKATFWGTFPSHIAAFWRSTIVEFDPHPLPSFLFTESFLNWLDYNLL